MGLPGLVTSLGLIKTHSFILLICVMSCKGGSEYVVSGGDDVTHKTCLYSPLPGRRGSGGAGNRIFLWACGSQKLLPNFRPNLTSKLKSALGQEEVHTAGAYSRVSVALGG